MGAECDLAIPSLLHTQHTQNIRSFTVVFFPLQWYIPSFSSTPIVQKPDCLANAQFLNILKISHFSFWVVNMSDYRNKGSLPLLFLGIIVRQLQIPSLYSRIKHDLLIYHHKGVAACTTRGKLRDWKIIIAVRHQRFVLVLADGAQQTRFNGPSLTQRKTHWL